MMTNVKKLGSSARDTERRCWHVLWARLIPAAGFAIGLAAWAFHEPQNAERLSRPLVAAVLLCSTIALRAVVRAVRSLRPADGEIVAATVGILRPSVVFSPRFTTTVDEAALRAAWAHEIEHVHHRDPLRIWAAQFVTDLLWPWQSAAERFRVWRNALELARDEEARAQAGIEGADLAAAILAAARLQISGACAGATLLSDAEMLEARVELLLQPAPPPPQVCTR